MSFTNSKIDKVYVVNLDKDKERLASFDRQMKKQNINYTRFPAILGSKVKESKYLSEFCNNHCTDGMKGCALSHHTIWQEAYEKKYKYILVFEDDAILSDTFDTKLNEIWSQIPDDFDIVYPGCRARCDDSFIQSTINNMTNSSVEYVNENVFSFGGDVGTHCYILSQKCIEKIYNQNITTHIDTQIQMFIQSHDLSAYFIKPVIVTVNDVQAGSTISEQFPPLITYLLNKIQASSSIQAGWMMNENYMKLAGFNINILMTVIMISLLFIPFFLFKWVFAWLFIEFIVSQDMKNTLRYLIFMSIPVAVRLRFAYETMPVKKIINLL